MTLINQSTAVGLALTVVSRYRVRLVPPSRRLAHALQQWIAFAKMGLLTIERSNPPIFVVYRCSLRSSTPHVLLHGAPSSSMLVVTIERSSPLVSFVVVFNRQLHMCCCAEQPRQACKPATMERGFSFSDPAMLRNSSQGTRHRLRNVLSPIP